MKNITTVGTPLHCGFSSLNESFLSETERRLLRFLQIAVFLCFPASFRLHSAHIRLIKALNIETFRQKLKESLMMMMIAPLFLPLFSLHIHALLLSFPLCLCCGNNFTHTHTQVVVSVTWTPLSVLTGD